MRNLMISMVALLGMAWSGLVTAQGQQSSQGAPRKELTMPDQDKWWFEVAPYLWMTAIDLDVDAGPVSADASMSFGDVLDDLQGALMIHAEAHKGPWGIFADLLWAKLDVKDNIGPMGGGTIDADMGMVFLEVGGLYRFGNSRFSVEPLVGMRAMFASGRVKSTGWVRVIR